MAPEDLAEQGVLDPLLNVDTKLFIDPMLLEGSSAPEVAANSYRRVREHFESILKLLSASRRHGDAAWREAIRRLTFREISATALGYGAGTTHGSGWGRTLASNVAGTASEIVELGVEDPELFILLPLIEKDIGPDRISDMVTRIILPDLAAATQRVCAELGVDVERFQIYEEQYRLPKNPTEDGRVPVILVPLDILRELPTASDWSEVAEAAAKSAQLRRRVNELIGDIWAAKTRREKDQLRERALSSRQAFEALLDCLHEIDPHSYDALGDPSGHLVWRRALSVAWDFPVAMVPPAAPTPDGVLAVVRQIVAQFKQLIENQGLATLLWHKGKRHHEVVAQKIFFAVAESYCVANNLEITPEAGTGVGPVDFKISASRNTRVLVEVKLSSNTKLVSGYEKQLGAYRAAQQTMRAIYLVVDVGRMGKKDEKLLQVKNDRAGRGEPVSEIVFVDGKVKPSASKR
ncbi:MAG: hypothetical protein ACQGVC_23910 [Myxococcota bacterium]